MKRITYWDVYKQALIPGDYKTWHQLCYNAAKQGIHEATIQNLLSAAFATNIGLLIGLPTFLVWLLS